MPDARSTLSLRTTCQETRQQVVERSIVHKPVESSPDDFMLWASRIAIENKDFYPLQHLLQASAGVDQHANIARFIHAVHTHEKSRGTAPNGTRPSHVSLVDRPDLRDGVGPNAPPMKMIQNHEFVNWGQTVKKRIDEIYLPTTIEGVRNLVKDAAVKGTRIRVAGFRHSWSDIFCGEGDALMIFLPLETLTQLPYPGVPSHFKSELMGITEVSDVAGRKPSPGHAFFRVMAGTTNDQLRERCFQHKDYCIPFNVIMVEVTMGGTNAPICHGSGLTSHTLSDLVQEVVYVDAKGDLQTVNDPNELRIASGCFGQLGIVISLTLQLNQMEVAELVPVKLPVVLAIPPPDNYPVPKELQDMLNKYKGQLDAARKEFIQRCEEDYYLEWFWFPYQGDVWVNTWKKRKMSSPADRHLSAYPDPVNVWLQQQEETAAECLVNSYLWNLLEPSQQAWLFGLATIAALPDIRDPKDTIKTYISEALHFRRGIQNFRVLDSEFEIPIPLAGGKRDYQLVQRAWWDGISAIYNAKSNAPVRVSLEVRLTGGSNVVLAPQRGNTNGTCSIEILSTLNTLGGKRDVWSPFRTVMSEKMSSYKDERGNYLNARPHWAKQFAGQTVRGGIPIEIYLKEVAFKDVFAEFRTGFEKIVVSRGGTVAEARERFGVDLIDRLIWQ